MGDYDWLPGFIFGAGIFLGVSAVLSVTAIVSLVPWKKTAAYILKDHLETKVP